MYRIGRKTIAPKRHRKLRWLIFVIIFLIIAIIAVIFLLRSLHPKTVITQSKAIITHTNYEGKTKHYDEGDFGVDIPVAWQYVPRPPNTYQSYTWQSSDSGTNGEQITIYEDSIPTNLAVNRALIITGETDHVETTGQASENCAQFTKDLTAAPNEIGVQAKWQNVDFLCNQVTTDRDVIGTSSTDGINIVILKTLDGTPHKFFFTYTDHQLSPDYSTFYSVLQSFKMN